MASKKPVGKRKLTLREMLSWKLYEVGCCDRFSDINGAELARRLDFSKQLISQVLRKGTISERFAWRLLLVFPDDLTDADIRPFVER